MSAPRVYRRVAVQAMLLSAVIAHAEEAPLRATLSAAGTGAMASASGTTITNHDDIVRHFH